MDDQRQSVHNVTMFVTLSARAAQGAQGAGRRQLNKSNLQAALEIKCFAIAKF